MFKMEKGFRVVSVSSIHSPVFVLPDRDLTNNTVNSDLYQVHNAILSVKSINDWPDFLLSRRWRTKAKAMYCTSSYNHLHHQPKTTNTTKYLRFCFSFVSYCFDIL